MLKKKLKVRITGLANFTDNIFRHGKRRSNLKKKRQERQCVCLYTWSKILAVILSIFTCSGKPNKLSEYDDIVVAGISGKNLLFFFSFCIAAEFQHFYKERRI